MDFFAKFRAMDSLCRGGGENTSRFFVILRVAKNLDVVARIKEKRKILRFAQNDRKGN